MRIDQGRVGETTSMYAIDLYAKRLASIQAQLVQFGLKLINIHKPTFIQQSLLDKDQY